MTTNATPTAPMPLAAPAARPLAYLVAALLAAIGIVCGHDFLVRAEAIDRPELIAGFVGWLDSHGWDSVLPPAAIGAVVVGAAFLVIAAKPRRRTHARMAGPADAWIRVGDVGRIASRTARRCPGVLTAVSVAGQKSAVVTVEGSNGHPELADDVRAAVARDLDSTLDQPPTVRVRISNRAPADPSTRRGSR